jgi:hypothetical protein
MQISRTDPFTFTFHEVTRFMTILLLATFIAQTARGEVVWLDQLDLTNVVQGWGTAQAGNG